MCKRKQPFECDARYNLIFYEALMLLPSYQNGFHELPGQSIEANDFIRPIKIRLEQNWSFSWYITLTISDQTILSGSLFLPEKKFFQIKKRKTIFFLKQLFSVDAKM